MYLITARFRPSRSKKNEDRKGVVYIRITGQCLAESGRKPERNVNTDIYGADESVLRDKKAEIVRLLRLLYCVVEQREDSGKPFDIDDIADDYRKALAGDASMSGAVLNSENRGAPLRAEIISVGREFKSEFRFVYSERLERKPDTLFDYINSQSRLLRDRNQISRSRGFLSTLSSICDFTEGNDVAFDNVDARFIENYSDWLKGSDKTESTQSFYLRTLRSILYQASNENLLLVDSRWFKGIDTKIANSHKSTFGRAIDRRALMKIEQADLGNDKSLELVRDMFMFGFYCRGMELVDIAYLTAENIQDGTLVYRRRLKGQICRVPLANSAMSIINRYKQGNNKYLFPLLETAGSVMFSTVRNSVSQSIKKIGEIAGSPQLSFSMNIGTWKTLMSQLSISDLLSSKIHSCGSGIN